MTVGKKLDEVMDWKGVNQSQIAQKAGISPAMISEYIRDVREPTLEALRRLADALDVTPWMLINGESMAVKDFELTKAERKLIGEYRMLSAASRKLLENTAQTLHIVERSLISEG